MMFPLLVMMYTILLTDNLLIFSELFIFNVVFVRTCFPFVAVSDFARQMAMVYEQFAKDIQTIISAFKAKYTDLRNDRYSPAEREREREREREYIAFCHQL